MFWSSMKIFMRWILNMSLKQKSIYIDSIYTYEYYSMLVYISHEIYILTNTDSSPLLFVFEYGKLFYRIFQISFINTLPQGY